MPKVVVVLPAYNAEKTLRKTIEDLPKDYVDEIILVDDASGDNTFSHARQLGITAFRHEQNLGYGANQKTCYRAAIEKGADIIVMIHPDYQYDPKMVKYLVEFIQEGHCDVMLGNRIRSRAETLAGGMPAYKYFSNRFLTFCENMLSGYNLAEWHTGMRAYRTEVLEDVEFEKNSNGFVFDSQMLFQIIEKGYTIGEIPVPVRYFNEASSINFWASLKYGLHTMAVASLFFLKKMFRPAKLPKTGQKRRSKSIRS